jgi:hypothetical protein
MIEPRIQPAAINPRKIPTIAKSTVEVGVSSGQTNTEINPVNRPTTEADTALQNGNPC